MFWPASNTIWSSACGITLGTMQVSTLTREGAIDAIHISIHFKTVISIVLYTSWFSQLHFSYSLAFFCCVSFSECFSPAGTTVQQITKHRLHWLLGLIERKASLVRSASACLCRNGHLRPTSPHQAKEPRNLSAVDHLTQRSITLWEDSFQMRRQSRQTMSGEEKKKKTPTPPLARRERPRGKSSTKTDGNSAEQLMHSSVWLGQDLRDYETLVEEEVERERGLCCCCLHHFAQLLTVLTSVDWHWLRSSI